MSYNEKILDHFTNPRNVGEIACADGFSSVGDPSCGDSAKVWIKVSNECIAEIKFKVFGCPAAIAVCSVMTELAMGKTIDEAYEITDETISDSLGGLPAEKEHCSNLGAVALHKAIMDYVFRSVRDAGRARGGDTRDA